MITTELSNIQGLVSSSRKLTVGMEFLRLMRDEGLLEANRGFFPAICGGAVRDGLFTGREINDIDIFLFRDQRAPTVTERIGTNAEIRNELEDIRQNILAWLEDMEADSVSLLSANAEAYFGVQRFVDIIQFVWREVIFQIMIPTQAQLSGGIDHLLRTMPLHSGMCLTLDYFRAYDTSVAHMWLPENQYFVATERDIPYLRRKAPNGRMIPVSNNREAAMIALSGRQQSVSLDEINITSTASMNINSASNMIRRALAERWGVSIDVLSANPVTPVNTQ